MPQQYSPHMLNSFNNAAQSMRTSSNTNKRSSLLRGLFGRYSSKKRTSKQATKKRIISGGDHVKLSSTKGIDFLSQGLRYDFQQVKTTPTINSSEMKPSCQDKS